MFHSAYFVSNDMVMVLFCSSNYIGILFAIGILKILTTLMSHAYIRIQTRRRYNF